MTSKILHGLVGNFDIGGIQALNYPESSECIFFTRFVTCGVGSIVVLNQLCFLISSKCNILCTDATQTNEMKLLEKTKALSVQLHRRQKDRRSAHKLHD